MAHDPEPPPPAPAPGGPPGPLVTTLVFLSLAAGAALVGLRALGPRGEAAAPPPVIAAVPDFTLEERHGGEVTLAGLRGRIWIADFIFTSCAGICPEMSIRMAAVHEAVRKDPDTVCVSITVDPKTDTPEVLRAYADRYSASRDRWLFLRGPIETVHALGYDGFGMLDREDPFLHSQRFVLVDREGRIRGYYRGTEDEGVRNLLADWRRIRGGAAD